MKTGVVVFPGSNCERDLKTALWQVTGREPVMLWHDDADLPADLDLIGVPGGYSFGDYLRPGAIAAHSPVMRAVADAAARGTRVLGICNGFQVLTETGLLPGALMRNTGLDFICRNVALEVVTTNSAFTSRFQPGETIHIPIAHQDGNYQADADTLDRLEQQGQVAFRYAGPVNGSARDIAGIFNEAGNVLGMMPHPERMADDAHSFDSGALSGTGKDGRRLFESLLDALG